MGLLQKLNSGVYDTPELSFKENQNIKSQENVSPIFINDFLISNDISNFAILEIINNHFFITNSFGYDVKSIYSSYSTVDFIKFAAAKFGWEGTKEPKDRKMLSELKRILKEWNDVPYKKTVEFIDVAKISAKFLAIGVPEIISFKPDEIM